MNADLNRLLEALLTQFEAASDATPVKRIDVKDVAKRDPEEREDEPPDEKDCERVGNVLKMVFGRPTCVHPSTTHIPGVRAVKRKKPVPAPAS